MFIYTLHALDKLKIKDNKILKITRKRIEEVVKKGLILRDVDGVITAVGNLDNKHSLCVVYRSEVRSIIVITFFAAEKGRYERKVLH